MPITRRHIFPAQDLPSDIGLRIRALRIDRRWSQMYLSRRSGVSRETIARVETGSRQPLADTVLRVLAALSDNRGDVELENVVPAWPESDIDQIIGHGPRSRERRRNLGCSLAEIARTAGVSESTLSRFERGAGATPSLLMSEEDPSSDKFFRLTSDALARALRFVDLTDHEAFCEDDDRRKWPIRDRTAFP